MSRRYCEADFDAIRRKWLKKGVGSGVEVTQKSMAAGSNPASSPYRSKLEVLYAQKLEVMRRAGMLKAVWYEPISLWLPGKVRYKPDFLIEFHDSINSLPGQRLLMIEVKGYSKNRRDAMTRLKIAASIFSCFDWQLAEYHAGDWLETKLN